MKKIYLATIFATASLPASAATVFSFQEGDLRKDGSLFGSGAGYSGAFEGSVTDNNPGGSVSAITVKRMGNQFRSTNANAGSNGQQWVGLFSIDLTELAGYMSANPSASVTAAQFSLTRDSANTNNFIAFSLYETAAFTPDATWLTTDGSTPWPAPVAANSTGAVGGGTRTAEIGANTPSNFAATLTWNTTTDFVSAVNNALASGDKTLYMAAQGTFFTNNDGFTNYNDSSFATIDARPELLVTVIPEPSTALLGAFGALALLRRRR